MKAGTYKLFFDTEGYWKKKGQESFYPYVEVRATGWPEGGGLWFTETWVRSCCALSQGGGRQ